MSGLGAKKEAGEAFEQGAGLEVKSALVPVPPKNKVIVGHRTLSLQLQLFSSLMDHYPYCLGADSWRQFCLAQSQYVSCVRAYQQKQVSQYAGMACTRNLVMSAFSNLEMSSF